MEKERDLLKSQVEIITRKAIESLEVQTAMFSLCESLQSKLKQKENQEKDTLAKMEFLLLKTKQSTDFAVESREQIER